ncbi:MAG: L-serine ammonia-lyase, iron-sulfur-dependent, subunit alpha [Vulcanimicrobiaceae bacterium]
MAFDPAADIVFDVVNSPPRHPNTLAFSARDVAGAIVAEERWLSIGGGFIQREDEQPATATAEAATPYAFANAAELLKRASAAGMTIAELMRANERAVSGAVNLNPRLDRIVATMLSAVDRGLTREGPLPGGLNVGRRAKAIHDKLIADAGRNARAAHEIMDYVAVYAMAVNEENAAGGFVVAADTPQNRDVVGNAGVLVPPVPAAFAAALSAPVADSDARRSAARRAAERFSIHAQAERMTGVYTRLLPEAAISTPA